jgi:hypothetical protein
MLSKSVKRKRLARLHLLVARVPRLRRCVRMPLRLASRLLVETYPRLGAKRVLPSASFRISSVGKKIPTRKLRN